MKSPATYRLSPTELVDRVHTVKHITWVAHAGPPGPCSSVTVRVLYDASQSVSCGVEP